MTAIRVLGILIAPLALCGIAEAQKGKPSTKNTPPTGSIADVSVTVNAEDTVIDLYAAYSDAQDPDTALTYTVSGNTNAAIFTSVVADSLSGTLTLAYAPDATGVSDITVQVTDSGGKTLSDTFNVEITSNVVFEDNFNFSFEEAWTTDPSLLFGLSPTPYASNLGSPLLRFSSGGTTLFMSAQNSPFRSRYALLTHANFGGDITVEARINTLTQDATNHDGLFELSVIDSTDTTRYIVFGLYAFSSGTDRRWFVGASGDVCAVGACISTPFNFSNNTWYVLRISDNSSSGLTVSILDGSGVTLLASHNVGFSLSALGQVFRIGISQFNEPSGVNMKSEVDYLRVTLN